MKTLFAGTFDPPTLGHWDIIQRGSGLFDQLIVAIAVNYAKPSGLFSIPERKKFLLSLTRSLSNVEVMEFTGLAVDFAKKIEADCLLRGVRSLSDFEVECQMAAANRKLSGIETFFLPADENYSRINSTLVREIAQNGGHLHGFVPDEIEEEIFLRIKALR